MAVCLARHTVVFVGRYLFGASHWYLRYVGVYQAPLWSSALIPNDRLGPALPPSYATRLVESQPHEVPGSGVDDRGLGGTRRTGWTVCDDCILVTHWQWMTHATQGKEWRYAKVTMKFPWILHSR